MVINGKSDPLLLPDHDPVSPATAGRAPWKVLVVDDEKDVHTVTTLALKHFEFEGRRLQFLHAHSGAEARILLSGTSDIALVLLDVVMETEHEGLDLVRYIREEIGNRTIRIVLRTGQPGHAPEHEVIRDYDINDYKEKSELTAARLFTVIYASLRSYRDIITLQKSRRGLEKLIDASRGIASRRALDGFVGVALEQLSMLLNLDDTKVFSCETSAFKLQDPGTPLQVFSTHRDLTVVEQLDFSRLEPCKRDILAEAIRKQRNVFRGNQLVVYCANRNYKLLLHASLSHDLSELDMHLLDMFGENLVVILENIRLHELIDESQREIIYRLGEVVESRSHETGFHVKRVAHYSELLARLVGLSDDETTLIKYASPLHDIGKIGIPDAILEKPGKLTAKEWEVMKTHAERGHEILKGSGLMLMDVGAIIALTHHEKWDGSGYPAGVAEENIPIYGRITALADVFDALGSARCYKKAWPLDQVLALVREQRGRHFDPRLVDLLLDNLPEFLVIRERFAEA